MRFIALLCFVSLSSTTIAAAADSKPIFNGKDLTGWEGDTKLWSLEKGAITGRTLGPEALQANQFLIWKSGLFGNFELKSQFRLGGNNNSGIQYRSRRLAGVGPHVVEGYQADIHARPWYTGMLYAEPGRGILANPGQRVSLSKNGRKQIKQLDGEFNAIDLSEWHELTILARGRKVIHMIDGQITMELAD